jgi:hypothetical protein
MAGLDPTVNAFIRASHDHQKACELAKVSLDRAVCGWCPYCSELHYRATMALNRCMDRCPPTLDQEAWDEKLARHAIYRRNNPHRADNDLEIYRTVPPLPELVTVADLPVPRAAKG